jgi:hypothetical protein
MKKLVLIIFSLCCWLGSSSAWAIECMSAAGDPKSGYYAWREIDGRKCWFKKTGAMPPKSELHWPAKSQEQARSRVRSETSEEPTVAAAVPPRPSTTESAERPAPVAVPPMDAESTDQPQSKTASPPPQFFKTIRVRPAREALVRLGNGQVDLMDSASVSAVQVLAPARHKPATAAAAAPADPFTARFSGQ